MGESEAGRTRVRPCILHTGAGDVRPYVPVRESGNLVPLVSSEAGASQCRAPLPQSGSDPDHSKGGDQYPGLAGTSHRYGAPHEALSLLPESASAGWTVGRSTTPPRREAARLDQARQTGGGTLLDREDGAASKEAGPLRYGVLHLRR